MPDRNAKLSIETVLKGTEDATAKTRDLRTEQESLGESAGKVSSELQDTASAVDQVAQAEAKAAGSASDAAGALQQMGATGTLATGEIAAGASNATQGVTVLAETSDAANATMTDGATKTAEAVAEVGEAATKAGKETVTATDQAAKSLEGARQKAAAFDAALEAISAAPLREQLVLLQELDAEFERTLAANIDNSEAGRALAEAQRTAWESVRTRIAHVTGVIEEQEAQYAGLSDEARRALASIATETLTTEQALIAAAGKIKAINDGLIETGTIAPAQIGKAAQAVENYRIAILGSADARRDASSAELAALQRLEAELLNVTNRANQLTNSSKDNAIGLKEQHEQASRLLSSLGALAGGLGATDRASVALFGKGAQLISAFGSLKSQVGEVLTSTTGAARAMIGTTSVITAYAAALLAGAAAGLKIAGANRENAEEIDALKKKLSEFFSPLEGLKTRLDAIQEGDAWTSIDRFRVALGRGREELDLFRLAERLGLKESEAFRLATEENAHILRFYRDAMEAGADGMTLWEEAVGNAGGSADALSSEVRRLRVHLDLLAESGQKAKEALRGDVLQALADFISRNVLPVLSQNADVINRTALELYKLERAYNGTTVTINHGLTSLREYISGGSAFSLEAARMAQSLQAVLDQTKGLDAAQRANIQSVIDMALRNDELSASERRYAAEVAASIIAGKNKVGVLMEQITASQGLKDAIESLLETVEKETTKQTEAETAIGRAAAAAREQLAANTQLDVSEKARLESIIALAESIDKLKTKHDSLAESQTAQTTATTAAIEPTQQYAENLREVGSASEVVIQGAEGMAASMEELAAKRAADFELFQQQTQESVAAAQQQGAAEAELTVVLSGKRAEIARQIEEQKQLLAAAAQQASVNETLATSTEKIRDVSEGATTAFTNLADKIKIVDEASGKVSGTIGGVLVEQFADGTTKISNMAAAADKAGISLGDIGTSSERGADAAVRAAEKMRDQLIPILAEIDAAAAKTGSMLESVGTKAENMGKAAEKAAGSD